MAIKEVAGARDEWVEGVNVAQERMRMAGVEFVVVGGMALRATLGDSVEWRRPNGTVVDFDAIGLGPDRKTIVNVAGELGELAQKHKYFPEVGLEPIQFGPRPKNFPPLEMLSGIRRDGDRYALTYRSVAVPVPEESFAARVRRYGELEIPTLLAEGTLWRYFERGGVGKPKDLEKVKRLGHFVGENALEQYGPDTRAAHSDFVSQVQARHPWIIGAYKTFWNFDKMVGGQISGAKGAFYSMISAFRG